MNARISSKLCLAGLVALHLCAASSLAQRTARTPILNSTSAVINNFSGQLVGFGGVITVQLVNLDSVHSQDDIVVSLLEENVSASFRVDNVAGTVSPLWSLTSQFAMSFMNYAAQPTNRSQTVTLAPDQASAVSFRHGCLMKKTGPECASPMAWPPTPGTYFTGNASSAPDAIIWLDTAYSVSVRVTVPSDRGAILGTAIVFSEVSPVSGSGQARESERFVLNGGRAF